MNIENVDNDVFTNGSSNMFVIQHKKSNHIIGYIAAKPVEIELMNF